MKIERRYKLNIIIPFVTMADIAFLLLIFLILSSSLKKTPDIKLSLPTAEQFEKIRDRENAEVFVSGGNDIILNRKKCDFEALNSLLPQEERCIISGDGEADFDTVYKIMETLKENDFKRITFAIKRKTDIIQKK